MKWLYIIAFVLLSNISFAQEDSIKISRVEFTQLTNVINRQIKRDSIQTELIKSLEKQIFNFRQVQIKDSTMLYLKDQRLDYYMEMMEIYNERNKYLEKQQNHWTRNPVLWFITGAVTIYVASEVVSNIK